MGDQRRRPTFILISGIFFLLVLGGLTIAALATAELNVATVIFAAVTVFVFVAVIGALIGAAKQPPDEEVIGRSRRRPEDE